MFSDDKNSNPVGNFMLGTKVNRSGSRSEIWQLTKQSAKKSA